MVGGFFFWGYFSEIFSTKASKVTHTYKNIFQRETEEGLGFASFWFDILAQIS